MNSFFTFLIILSLSFSTESLAQYYRVLFTSNDISSTDSIGFIKHINFSEASDHIWVKYKDGHKVKIKNDTIWGFSDKKSHIYRFFKGDIYKVTLFGYMVKYERETQIFVGKPGYTGNAIIKYNSIGLNGEIRPDT
jgi:hypothetical protein